MTTKLELQFRQDLLKTMRGLWYADILAESPQNPGYPDLAFVMLSTERVYETGWIELKAVSRWNDIEVRQSQIEWMRKWSGLVPAFFLFRVGDGCHLINGHEYEYFRRPLKELPCRAMSFPFESLRSVLPDLLRHATNRFK